MNAQNVIPFRPRGAVPDLAALARQWMLEEEARAQAAASAPPEPPPANVEMLRLLRRIDRTLAKLQGSLQQGDLGSKAG